MHEDIFELDNTSNDGSFNVTDAVMHLGMPRSQAVACELPCMHAWTTYHLPTTVASRVQNWSQVGALAALKDAGLLRHIEHALSINDWDTEQKFKELTVPAVAAGMPIEQAMQLDWPEPNWLKVKANELFSWEMATAVGTILLTAASIYAIRWMLLSHEAIPTVRYPSIQASSSIVTGIASATDNSSPTAQPGLVVDPEASSMADSFVAADLSTETFIPGTPPEEFPPTYDESQESYGSPTTNPLPGNFDTMPNEVLPC